LLREVYLRVAKRKENYKDRHTKLCWLVHMNQSNQEVSDKIAEMLSSQRLKLEVKIVFLEQLGTHTACPKI
jgi:hypothetical protein